MKYIIKIPEPCHEDWSQMTPTEKGKFCASCKKEVIDFTKYSNYEIVRKLDRNESVCGRFKETQLNRELKSLKKRSHTKVNLAASFMALFSSITPLFGQQLEINKTEIRDSISDNINIISENGNDVVKIKGNIIGDKDNLIGAKIIIKGTTKEMNSDFDGNFNIEIPKERFNDEVILVFSYLGFETKEIIINSLEKFLKIELKIDEEIYYDLQVILGRPSVVQKRNIIEKIKDSLSLKKVDCKEPIKTSENKK